MPASLYKCRDHVGFVPARGDVVVVTLGVPQTEPGHVLGREHGVFRAQLIRGTDPLPHVEVGRVISGCRRRADVVVVPSDYRGAEVKRTSKAQALVLGQGGSVLRGRFNRCWSGYPAPGVTVYKCALSRCGDAIQQIPSIHARDYNAPECPRRIRFRVRLRYRLAFAEVGKRSAKMKPSRSTISPTWVGTGARNMGPEKAKV